jgi:hypothetical protein
MPTYSVTEVPQNITDLIVTDFKVVAHVAPTPLDWNHWSIFLIHSHGCVRLNVPPDAESTIVEVQITDFTADANKAEERSWDFRAAKPVHIYYVIKLILDHGRWKYDTTIQRVGSRHWV